MTQDEAREIAREAARQAVADTFLHLGYDVSDKEQVRGLKADLLHLRRWRVATDSVGKAGLITVAGILITGFAGLLWAGIQVMFDKH